MTCPKLGADQRGADRGSSFATDLGRCAACATGARAASRRGADRGCASATDVGRKGLVAGEVVCNARHAQIQEQIVEVIKVILQEQRH